MRVSLLVWRAMLIGGLGAASISAQTVNWTGAAASGAWGTAANWDSDPALPVTADVVGFNAAAANAQYTIDLSANRTVGGLVFAAAGANGFTFSAGNTLTIGASGIVNNHALTQTFAADVRTAGTTTWDTAGGGLDFADVALASTLNVVGSSAVAINGTLTNTGGNRTLNNTTTAGGLTIAAINLSDNNTTRQLSFSGTGATSVTGVIADGGTGAGNLRKTGTGTLTLLGANTYSGSSNLSGGTIVIGDDAAFGTSTVTLGTTTIETTGGARSIDNAIVLSGTVTFAAADPMELNNVVTLNGNRNVNSNGSGVLTFNDVALSSNATTRRLTLGGTGETVMAGVISNGAASAGNFTKTGTGTVTLSGANTFSGITTLSGGTVIIGNDAAFGSSLVNLSSSTLRSDGPTRTLANTLQLTGNSTSIQGAGALVFTGPLTLTGSRSLDVSGTALTTFGDILLSNVTSNRTLTFTGTGDTLVNGVISNGPSSTTSSLIMSGSGSLTLAGVNTYGGSTTLNSGTVVIADETGLGADPASFSTARLSFNGGTLRTTASFAIDDTNRGVRILAGGATIETDSGTTLTFANAITSSGGLTKTGAGTLVLTAANSYTGTTTVSAGTLQISADNGLGATPGGATAGKLTVDGATLATDATFTLASNRGIAVGAGGAMFDTATGTTLSYGGIAAGSGAVTKTGTGTLELSGSNTFSGNVVVSNGTLAISNANALGSGGSTTVNSGGTLALSNNITVATETGGLSLNGIGFSGGGALQNTSGDNLWDGNITLAGNATIKSLAGQLKLGDESSFTDSLSLGANTVSFDTSGGNLWVNSIISGTGDVIKNGSGTLTYYMDENSYTGTTTVRDGTLFLNTLSDTGHLNVALNGGVVIGDGVGGAQSAVLQHASSQASALISDSANFTIYADGLYDLNKQVETIGSLTLEGGAVSLDVGVLTLSGNLTTLASGQTATIASDSVSGSLSFGGGTRTISVADGAASSDLTISAQIAQGSMIKTGAGTLTLAPASTNDNSYTGTTTINQGIVNIQSNTALGGADNLAGSGTTVSTGAQLQTQGNLAVGAERLVLNGTGISGDGALRNLSGTSSWAGNVIVNTNARVQVDAGTLTFNGTITGGGTTLTIAGAGDINLTNTTSLNSVVKEGSGILTVSGTQNYVTASIDGGNYVVGASNILSDAMTVTIGSGATMKVNGQTDTIAAIAGAGTLQIASGGHLTVGAGNAAVNFSGNITGDGTGTFEKIGTGTLTFNSSFDFDGDITFGGGTLQLANVTIGANTLHITADSIIDFSGSSTLNVDNLIIDSGVTISIINWADTVDYFYASNWSGATYDTRFNTPTTQVVFDGGSPAWTGDNTIWLSYDNQITPVPEPRAYGLLLMGLSLGAITLRRRPRR